jgi:hypothetical protein
LSSSNLLLKHARREALLALLIWFAAAAYTVGYCTIRAYQSDVAPVPLILGIPSWVVWGVLMPWLVCIVVSWWFAYRCMADDPLTASGDIDVALPASDTQIQTVRREQQP